MRIVSFFAAFIICGSLTLASCTEKSEEKETSQKEKTTEHLADVTLDDSESNDSKDDAIQSRYAYDQDWENIKDAILNKDIEALVAYSGSDDLDEELLIQQFHADQSLLEQLRKSTYKDLTETETDKGVMLQFSATLSGSDKEGNTYESGLYLYMSQGDPNLLLEYYLAAG